MVCVSYCTRAVLIFYYRTVWYTVPIKCCILCWSFIGYTTSGLLEIYCSTMSMSLASMLMQ